MEHGICCITGHRKLPEDKLAFVTNMLTEQVRLAMEDGYRVFLSGFADGVDLLFAQTIVALKQDYPDLFLEAAIPYANRLKSTNRHFQKLLRQCNGHKIICQQYQPDCFVLRNRYMVQQAGRAIAVYDGRETGGTVFTMRDAHCLGRDFRVIDIHD